LSADQLACHVSLSGADAARENLSVEAGGEDRKRAWRSLPESAAKGRLLCSVSQDDFPNRYFEEGKRVFFAHHPLGEQTGGGPGLSTGRMDSLMFLLLLAG